MAKSETGGISEIFKKIFEHRYSIIEDGVLVSFDERDLSLTGKYIVPSEVKKIRNQAFSNSNIKTIIIPSSVKEIGDDVFSGCEKLTDITFSEGLEYMGSDCFVYCDRLKHANAPSSIIGKLPLEILKLDGLNIDGKPYKVPDRLKNLSSNFYDFLKNNYSYEEIVNFKLKKIINVSNHILGEEYDPVMDDSDRYIVQLACHHLGVLGDDQFAQIMGEFLKNLEDKKKLKFAILYSFAFMKKTEVNKNFAIFFKDNYYSILKYLHETDEESIRALLVDIHDNFDELSKSFVSDNAAARQKKPTLEFFMETLNKVRFGENIDEKYAGLAEEMLKFTFYTKEDFEKACGVYDKFLELTKKELSPTEKAVSKCMERAFGNMERIEKSIEENLREATANIGKSIDQEETWEWIEKNDPQNYTLGLYCNCCARIGGAGEGIAIASILDPNVRNLVVKDKNGRPIAKATLYVNHEKGYALFNNFEVANGVREEKIPRVYELLKEATNNFVKNYNKEAVERHIPVIKKVNVGMGCNDLEEFLSEKSAEILKGLDFSKYSEGSHAGDWMEEQYVFLNATSTQAKDVNNEDVTI